MSAAAVVARPQLVPEADLPETETNLYLFTILDKNITPEAEAVRDLLVFSSDKGRYALSVDGGDGAVHVKVRWTEDGEVAVAEVFLHRREDGAEAEEPVDKRKRSADEEQQQPEQAEDADEEPPSPKKARSSSEDEEEDGDDEEFVPDDDDDED